MHSHSHTHTHAFDTWQNEDAQHSNKKMNETNERTKMKNFIGINLKTKSKVKRIHSTTPMNMMNGWMEFLPFYLPIECEIRLSFICHSKKCCCTHSLVSHTNSVWMRELIRESRSNRGNRLYRYCTEKHKNLLFINNKMSVTQHHSDAREHKRFLFLLFSLRPCEVVVQTRKQWEKDRMRVS